MMLLAAPWFVWANVRTDNQFFETFFWFHNVERGLGSEVLKAHPWWFYFAHAPFDLLPWTLVVPVAMIYMLRKPELRGDLALRLGLIWFGAVFVFLSCMSFKRADYLLPAFPGLAIFLGACAEAWWRQDHSDRARRFAVSGLGAVLAMCIAGWLVHTTWFLSAEERDWPYRRMAAEIRQQTTGAVVFFQAESHPLAFHLGHPVTTVLEWENLQWWCDRDKPIYIVMPEATAAEWRAHLGSEALVEVLHSSDFLRSSHPIAVFRNRGKPPANP
jgi:4-amino-4-deoxy-L-arabinose transferase-like glycosyltransferase